MKVIFATITSKKKNQKVKIKIWHIERKEKVKNYLSQKRHLKNPYQKKSKYCVDLSRFEYYKINGIFT
jgi:hypothetical protein